MTDGLHAGPQLGGDVVVQPAGGRQQDDPRAEHEPGRRRATSRSLLKRPAVFVGQHHGWSDSHRFASLDEPLDDRQSE
jgi:hypothetical protein